jgi:hypothetical protein
LFDLFENFEDVLDGVGVGEPGDLCELVVDFFQFEEENEILFFEAVGVLPVLPSLLFVSEGVVQAVVVYLVVFQDLGIEVLGDGLSNLL